MRKRNIGVKGAAEQVVLLAWLVLLLLYQSRSSGKIKGTKMTVAATAGKGRRCQISMQQQQQQQH